jgi:hypothetical protein
MNGLYTFLLFLFVFGTVTAGINEMALFDYTMPTNGAVLDEGVITDIQSGSEQTSLNPLNAMMIIFSFMKVIGAGIVAMFFVVPTIYTIFTMVGADPTWAMIAAGIIQAPLTFITLFGLFEWWSGRSLT